VASVSRTSWSASAQLSAQTSDGELPVSGANRLTLLVRPWRPARRFLARAPRSGWGGQRRSERCRYRLP
jgi:hypothetical protein